MNRNTLRTIHIIASMIGLLCIATFWTSTLISELFFSHQMIALIKQVIVYTMFLFIPCMAIAGATGMKMGRQSTYTPIVRKRKRMPIIALNGLLVLLPCAFYLHSKAQLGEFDYVFYAVQMLELLAGMCNLILMGLNMKDGLSIRKR